MAFYHTACFVFTIMIVCNAILYPNLYSVIFKMWFGGGSAEPEKQPIPEYPPHMRGGRGPGPGGRMQPGMGGGPRPGVGARPPMGGAGDASSFMASQPTESRGRGMMGTVLPVYALGIFIYFGYVIYKVFVREKPNNGPPVRPSWGYPEDSELQVQDGPTPRREQEERLQRQLAAELKAANYTEFKPKHEKKKKKSKASPKEGSPKKSDNTESTDEVDILKRRLEETEKNMQRMMTMMNSMGVAMNTVSHHLASTSDKPIPRKVLSKLNDPDPEVDQNLELDIEASDPIGVNVDGFSDEEDLLIGDRMEGLDDEGNMPSSDEEEEEEEEDDDEEENDVSCPKDSEVDRDPELLHSNKLNIVDVDGDYDDDDDVDDDDDGEVDSDDESEEENTRVQESSMVESLRRRNVKTNASSEGAGIEG